MVRWLVLALVLSVNDVQSHLMICLITHSCHLLSRISSYSLVWVSQCNLDVSALVLVEASSCLGPLSPFASHYFPSVLSMGERKSGSMGPRGPATWQAAPKVKMPLPAVLSGPVRNHGEVPAIWPF